MDKYNKKFDIRSAPITNMTIGSNEKDKKNFTTINIEESENYKEPFKNWRESLNIPANVKRLELSGDLEKIRVADDITKEMENIILDRSPFWELMGAVRIETETGEQALLATAIITNEKCDGHFGTGAESKPYIAFIDLAKILAQGAILLISDVKDPEKWRFEPLARGSGPTGDKLDKPLAPPVEILIEAKIIALDNIAHEMTTEANQYLIDAIKHVTDKRKMEQKEISTLLKLVQDEEIEKLVMEQYKHKISDTSPDDLSYKKWQERYYFVETRAYNKKTGDKIGYAKAVRCLPVAKRVL